jgi:hypothetical protein
MKINLSFFWYNQDIKNLIRTSVANNIGLTYITNPAKPEIDTEFKYHPWFPTIIKK